MKMVYIKHLIHMKLEATYGFMLTTKDQYTYGFNWKVTSGKLIWMCDRNGNKVNVNYDSNGKIQNITDSFGRSITIEYNSNGLISKVQDPLNRTIQYQYLDGKLSKVIDNGKVTIIIILQLGI